MKKVILLSALMAVSQISLAKDCMGKMPFDHHHPPSIEQRVEHMTKRLNLTPEQASQIIATFESMEPQQQALREQMKALREQERNAVDAILTDEQKAAIKDMHRGYMRDSDARDPDAESGGDM